MMKEYVQDEKILLKFLCIFLIIQPFLDIRYFFTDPQLQFLGFSIPTLVRCFGIGIMALLSIPFIKKDKEHLFYGIYFICLAVYFIAHHLVAGGDIDVPASYRYSLFSEVFYIIRMILPFVIVYVTRHVKISYETFIRVIMIVSMIIGTVITVTNLLHISTPSYAIGGTQNQLNFIEWFFYDLSEFSFESLTSKGWFFMANQISGLIILLAPLNYYELIRRPRVISVASTLLISIAMLLLGTRVATYGLLMVIAVVFFMFLFFAFVKKQLSFSAKKLIPFACVTLVIFGLFLNSPIKHRVYTYGEVEEPDVEIPSETESPTLSSKERYIMDNYKNYKIQDAYIKVIYPYTYDADFWLDFFKKYSSDVKNNRQMQQIISDHIVLKNQKAMKHVLFGYSYTRFTNGHLYLENDFLVHTYTMGILGMLLLLGPWIFYMCRGGWIMLRNFKEKFDFLNCTLVVSLGACLGCSIFSGHVVDELIVTLFIGFVCGYFIHRYEGRNVEDEKH